MEIMSQSERKTATTTTDHYPTDGDDMKGVITEGLPDGVPLVAPFNHPVNRVDYYYPRLVDAEIPSPETAFFDVELQERLPVFNERDISEHMMDKGWLHAFVRGMYTSAKLDLRAGSHLHSQDRNDIRRTVTELISQHIMMERPLGSRIAVREYIDLDYCPDDSPTHHHETEVRYFIRDGEVLYRFPSESDFVDNNLDCDDLYSYVREDLEQGVEYPDSLAEKAATEFSDLSWSVDFVRDAKTGDWYCPDMGLNGLYWSDRRDEWVSISEHQDESKSPERFADEMPNPKELNINPS